MLALDVEFATANLNVEEGITWQKLLACNPEWIHVLCNDRVANLDVEDFQARLPEVALRELEDQGILAVLAISKRNLVAEVLSPALCMIDL